MSATVHGAGAVSPLREEVSAMLRLSWPLILTNMAQTLMTATDVVILGRLGPDALAASALGTSLHFTLVIFGLGLVLATQPMMARDLGENRFAVRELRRTARQGLWSAIAVAGPVWFVLWNAGAILGAMGQEPKLAAMAGTYCRSLQWSVLPFYGFVVLRSFISALERPGWGLVIGLFAIVFNALANWCLVFGNFGFPALGIAGSGLATTISMSFMFLGLAAIIMIDRRFRRYRLFGRFWRADWPRLAQLWRLGLPIGFIMIFEVVLFTGSTAVMGYINQASLAAHAIALQIASVAFMAPLGFGQAATVRIGRAYGAGDSEGIRLSGVVAFFMVMAFMSMTAMLMVLFPTHLIGIFIDTAKPENASALKLGIVFLSLAAMFQLFDGAQAVLLGMLRGLHDTKMPMVFAALSYWCVGMPVGLWLAFKAGWEGAGIWTGLLAGLAAVSAMLGARWLRRGRLGLEAGKKS
jgi:multidrug resistance protein, MATE family